MKKSSFVEGAFIATFAIVISKVLGLVYVIPFYSIIGDQGGALYGYAYNIYNLFLIISTAGIPFAISKLTSEYYTLKKENEKMYMLKVAKIIIAVFSILSFLICFIFAPLIAKLIIGNISGGNTINDVTFVIRCVSFALLIIPFLSIRRGFLQGHKYIGAPSMSQVIEQLIRIIVIIVGSFLALNVFHLSLTNAVGIAVFGATAGGLCAYFYLVNKCRQSKNLYTKLDESKINKKEIIKKIIIYTIPFIIINITNHLYNTVDMILVIKGLNLIGYKASDIETISSVLTTWGNKLNSIVTAVASGLVVSLIPSLVSAYVKKEQENINKYFNTTIKIIFYIIIPISLFLSIFASQVWTIFYGKSFYGPIIFRYSILVAILDATYIITCSILQSLNKYILIYISVITGLLLNAILDVPLILLFNRFNIYPYYGAITATVIGYIVSLSIAFISLKKHDNIDFSETKKNIFNILKANTIIVILCFVFRLIIRCIEGRIATFICLMVIGIVIFIIYYLTNKKVFDELLGKNFVKKLFRKKD